MGDQDTYVVQTPGGRIEEVGALRLAEMTGEYGDELVIHEAHTPQEPIETEPAREVGLYEGSDGKWYWHRVAPNGEIVADSGQGYATEAGARKAAKRENPGMPIGEVQKEPDGAE